MNRWIAPLRYLYTAPFQISIKLVHDGDIHTLEERRQQALARLIICHLVAIQSIGLLLALVNASSRPVLLAQSGSLGYALICVILLFTRRITVGILLYVFGIFLPIAGLHWITSGAISLLSVLVSMVLVVFILLSGLLLPARLMWLAMGLSIAAIWLNLAFASVEPSLQLAGGNPKVVIGGFFTIVFLSVALLTYLLARSISAGTTSMLHAYQQQQELATLKDQFIIYVNHELRTPLVGLYGNVELVLKLGDQIDQARRTLMLTRALQSGDTILAMLNSALDMDIIRPEAVHVQMESLTLLPLVRQIVERFDPREIGEFGLAGTAFVARDITLSLPADLEVVADPLRLQQILNNLLSNALKYSATGSPITIRASYSTTPQALQRERLVQISVQDQGLGVPANEARQLFQRFVRLKRDITSTIRGTGVGLYLCRILVEAMGGQIWVASTGIAGEGSTFHFTLPQAIIQPAQGAQPRTEQRRVQAGDPAGLFTGEDISGRMITLQEYAGKKVFLTFLRSASCPLCGVRLLHLVQQHARLQTQGLEIIAVIESTREVTERYVAQLHPPFPVIPDPDKTIFRLYGVERGFGGVIRGLILRSPVYWEAWRKRVGGRISNGDLSLLPADFLIDPDLTIRQAHYGKDTGDHLGLHDIEEFAAPKEAIL